MNSEKKVWFIKNMSHEGAGLFAPFLEQWKVPYEIVDLHLGGSFPEIRQGDAAVILGGPDSANDRTTKILEEIRGIQRELERGTPFLGVCLGLQLLVKARGGRVLKSPVKEMGFRGPDQDWFTVRWSPSGMKDPLLKGIPSPIKIFQLHGETVELGTGMECLAEGRFCKNQIVKIQEKAYGIQGHVELSEAMFEEWLRKDTDLRCQDVKKLKEEFCKVRNELEQNSRMLFLNFLNLAGVL